MVHKLRLKSPLYYLFAYFLLFGCDSNSGYNQAFDFNQDGIDDVHYERAEDGHYYEISDRNFDSKFDESIQFDERNLAVTARRDDNFDGRLDTAVEYQNAYVRRTLTDTNENWLFDAATYYKGGLPVSSKFLEFADSGELTIRIVRYEFGLPAQSELTPYTESEEEFHSRLNPRILLNVH